MPRLSAEPSVPIRSMQDLLAVALAMETEAAERYAALAQRMHDAGRPDVAAVFERLVREESGHRTMIAGWSQQALRHAPAAAVAAPAGVFDDEGAALASPDLQDAYRSFAMAVRNEERAFVFWSYVAAHGASPEIREGAERMAREELEHAKTLRRERRRAFFEGRRSDPAARQPCDLSGLEMEVAKRLEDRAGTDRGAGGWRTLAMEARALSLDLAADPLPDPAPAGPPPGSLDGLCEWLADRYIEAGERLPSQAARDRAQALATVAVKRLAVLRSLDEAEATG